jgi:hypothetical protein
MNISLIIYACHHSVNWLTNLEPIYNIHILNCPKEELGCYDESYGYLSFIINNYKTLRGKYIFLHGHNTAWHYDTPAHYQLKKLLKTSYFITNPFGGVYCITNTVFTLGQHSGSMGKSKEWYWDKMFLGTRLRIPRMFRYPCCGTFFVEASHITQHSVKFYKKIRDNLSNFSIIYKRKKLCGRVLEGSWKTIFNGYQRYVSPPYCSQTQIYH